MPPVIQIKNVYDPAVAAELVARLNTLAPETLPQWGKMNVAQMLAHCSVAYEMAFEDKHPPAGALMGWVLRTFVKRAVVNTKPYPKGSPTAPAFKVSSQQDFEQERRRLIHYVERTAREGASFFEGRRSPSFGVLTAQEWSHLFYKHLDHHLTQFGA
jgi:hypothetical protein